MAPTPLTHTQPPPPGCHSPGALREPPHRLAQAAVFSHGHIRAEQGLRAGHGMLLRLAQQQAPAGTRKVSDVVGEE